MGNKKLKQDLTEKIAAQITDLLKGISPESGKKIDKTVKNSAQKLSGILIKKIKKAEKTKKSSTAVEKKKKATPEKAPTEKKK